MKKTNDLEDPASRESPAGKRPISSKTDAQSKPSKEKLPDRMEPEPVAQIVHRGREMGF